jgi:hypothetical protein
MLDTIRAANDDRFGDAAFHKRHPGSGGDFDLRSEGVARGKW